MNFKGLAIQTDVLCASGTTTAYFPPDALVSCTAVLSPTEPETLSFAIPRTDARLSEVIVGRVVRTRFTDSTDDVEWDIVAIDDSSRSNVVQVTALPILMRLARCIVNTTSLSDGSVTFDYTGVDLQASEWLDELIFPATTAAGLTWITAGTIDSTRRFGIAGEWSSALEVLAAIAAPGSASCEYRLRRNGNTGYYLDLVTQIGSSAATVRVRPQVNLLETARQRNAVDIATRLYPRGSTSSVSTRTMANHIWQVDSVVSSTVLQLRDVNSGVGPIAYDDQLNGLWLAPMNSTTFSSQEVTDSVASNQRVTISNTTGIVAGDWVRFFHEAGSTAQRVTSVTHPTLVKPPTQGGIGDRGQILDRPNIVADTNLAKNPTMVNWTVSADPPNTWSEYAATPANVSFDKESTDVVIHGTNTWRIRTTGTSSGARGEPLIIPPDGVFSGALVLTQQPGVRVETGDISVWKLATARHTATVWLKVADCPPPVGYDNARVYMYLRDVSRPDFATKPIHPSLQAGLIGTWDYDEGSERGTWLRFQSAPFDLSTFVDFGVSTLNQYHNDIDKVNGKVRVCIELAGGNTGSSTITDKYLYPNYLGTWSSVATYSTNDVVLHVVSGVTRYFIALTTSNNKQPENHLGTNWAEIDGGTGTQQYAGQNVASGWDVYVGPVTVAESTEPIGDREYSGGTELWQSANAALPSRSAVARGYDLRVADLARDDGTTYGDYEFVPGGTIEVINPELDNDVASLRLVEYRPNYLQPLQSEVRVGLPPERLTDLTGQYTDAGTTAAPTTTGAGTVVSGGGTFSLPDTGVVPGTYGSATQTPQIIVDAKGRLTSAANVTIVAGTAAALTPGATINGQLFTGASNITITAGTPQALTAGSYLTSGGTFDGTNPRTFAVDATDANTASKVVARDASGNFAAGTITAALQGNASTATALQTARNINGVSFNGTADITVTAAAGTLTGNTLASGVTASSLTSVGTIGTGIWQGTSVGKNYGGTGLTSSAFTGVTNERVFAYDGGSGTFFVAPSGTNGQALIYSGGALAWGNPAPGSHVLADTTGLGAEHTVSGLTSGMILQATGATTARFQTPSIPASSVTAGTFSGTSYTITNDLTVSGTLTASLPFSSITSKPTTLSGYGITDALSNSTSSTQSGYFGDIFLWDDTNPSHYLQVTNSGDLSASRTLSINVNDASRTVSLSGNLTVSGNADISGTSSGTNTGDQTITLTGAVTGSGTGSFATTYAGTVPIAKGGTNKTSYSTTGTGTRVAVYDQGTGAFDVVSPGSSGQFLQSSGTTGDVQFATPPNFTSSAAGYAPASGGGTSNFLRADGTWAVPAVGSVSANNVTAGTFSGATYTFSNSVTFTSGVRVAFGETYKILNSGGTAIDVLSATTLGAGVINSSLTSVGTLTSGALGAGFTAIDNARLANSSITINGSSVSLGGSITVDTSKWTSSGSNIYFNTGNVAIGTTPSASYRLLLRGTGATSATYALGVENSAATNTFYVRDDGNVAIPNGNLGIGVSPSANARLYVNGSVGIGIASPGQSLDVAGRIRSQTSTVGSSDIIAESTASTGTGYARLYLKNVDREWRFIADGTVSGSPLYIYDGTVGTVRQTINSSGYVGLGTTNPETNLHIYNSGQPPIVNGLYANVIVGTDSTANFQRIRFDVGTTPYWGLTRIGTSNNFAITGRISSTWSDNVFVISQSSGNVGIGTGSPNVALEVAGLARFTGTGGFSIGEDAAQNRIRTISGSRFAFYNSSDVLTGLAIRSLGVGGTYGTIATPTNGAIIEGSVGIGTSSPQMPLQVSGGSAGSGGWNRTALLSATFPVLVFESTYTPKFAGIGYDSTSAMRFWLNASSNDVMATSPVMSILNNGSVGIGTTSPSVKLHVVDGGIRAQGSGSQIDTSPSGGAFRFYDGSTFYGGLGMAGWAGLSAPSSDIVMYLSGVNYHITSGTTTRLYIENSTGNVGIGTTSPATGLHVKSSGNYGTITSDTSTSTGGGAFGIRKNGSVIGYLLNKGAWFGDTSNDLCIAAESGYNFRIYTGGTIGEKFIVTTTGNVGIGVSSPSYKLHVRDDIIAVDTTTSTSLTGFYAKWSGGDTGIRMTYRPNDALCFIDSTYPRTAGTVYGDIDIRQNVGGTLTSRLYIKNDTGFIGIGTTSPGNPLTVVHTNLADPYAGILVKNTDTTGAAYTGVVVDAVLQSHVRFMLNGSLKWQWRVGAGNGTDDMRLYSWTAGNDVMQVTNGGNIIASVGNTLLGAQTGWASGRLQVGTTSTSNPAAEFNGTGNTAGLAPVYIWNNVESGSTYFISFYSDGQNNARTLRGYINYRRDIATMNLTTASDYRIKTVYGEYTKSGAIFDKIKVHEATINGESGRHPMVLAHELDEAYPVAVEGEKDAVNEDGTPKLQMVSYNAMIPLMLAEIKSLRARVAALES